ncbi:cannabinoid receptor [Porites harrisoni]
MVLVFYLPYVVVQIVDVFVIGSTRTIRIAYDYAETAVFINSFLNPLVYCWRIREIKRAVKNILRRERPT